MRRDPGGGGMATAFEVVGGNFRTKQRMWTRTHHLQASGSCTHLCPPHSSFESAAGTTPWGPSSAPMTSTLQWRQRRGTRGTATRQRQVRDGSPHACEALAITHIFDIFPRGKRTLSFLNYLFALNTPVNDVLTAAHCGLATFSHMSAILSMYWPTLCALCTLQARCGS